MKRFCLLLQNALTPLLTLEKQPPTCCSKAIINGLTILFRYSHPAFKENIPNKITTQRDEIPIKTNRKNLK
jgi:hypothetical protein